MKLSEQLKQDHESGDCGRWLEGYAERAKQMEDIIKELCDCLEATYSGSPEGRAYLRKVRDALSGQCD